MRFEHFIAKRYITTHKQHSVLTVSSIAAATTLIVMLLTLICTLWACTVNLDSGEYHCRIVKPPTYNPHGFVTKEEAAAYISQMDGVESCTADNTIYYIRFESYTMDIAPIMQGILEALGVKHITNGDGNVYAQTGTSCYVTYYHERMVIDGIGKEAQSDLMVLLTLLYIFVIILLISMRMMIDNAFEISAKDRLQQLGMLQSIGCTPKQIVGVITHEAILLALIGIPIGTVLGIGMAYVIYLIATRSPMTAPLYEDAQHLLRFTVNPLFLLIVIITGFAWVWFSAYGVGRRIIKTNTMDAVTGRSKGVRRKGRILWRKGLGWQISLSARNIRRAPKRFFTTVAALAVAMCLFTGMNYIISFTQSILWKDTFAETENHHFCIMSYDDKWVGDPQKPWKILEDSGYFTNVYMDIPSSEGIWTEQKDVKVTVSCFTETEYNTFFTDSGETPLVSYEELNAQDGLLMIVPPAGDHNVQAAELSQWNILQVDFTDAYGNIQSEAFSIFERSEAAAKQIYVESDFYSEEHLVLIITPQQLMRSSIPFSLYGCAMYFDLAEDADYGAATAWLEQLELQTQQNEGHLHIWDNYNDFHQRDGLMRTMQIICGLIFSFVALIAGVHLVNIISTGLLDRRRELASMLCSGMTERQLTAMTLVECLQYVLTAAITAIALSTLAMFGADQLVQFMHFEEIIGQYISYTVLIPDILIAAAGAVIIAVITTFLSLHAMKTESPVEQLRNVD